MQIIILLLLFPCLVYSLTFSVQEDQDIVGEIKKEIIYPRQNFFNIARKYDLGTFELMEANPKVHPRKITKSVELIIPTAFILPNVLREGLVLNLAELRLYYFHKHSNRVSTFPVGIGRVGWRTPVGVTNIIRKTPNPTWVPTRRIREAALRKGKVLPEFMPPGPNNPLGKYALSMAWDPYKIHGTNEPESVGLRSSSGCIRMYPEDIEQLFKLVEVGTKVTIIHEPNKIGKLGNRLYLEAHEPLRENYYRDETEMDLTLDEVLELVVNREPYEINWAVLKKETQTTFGYPVPIGFVD